MTNGSKHVWLYDPRIDAPYQEDIYIYIYI